MARINKLIIPLYVFKIQNYGKLHPYRPENLPYAHKVYVSFTANYAPMGPKTPNKPIEKLWNYTPMGLNRTQPPVIVTPTLPNCFRVIEQ